MKIVNDSIKNALKQPTTQRKGRILINDKYYEVFNVEYYADAYDEGNVVGNAIASQLDFDLPYMAKFDTFKYFDGVWTGIDYEYVDMGTFNVFDEKDEDEFNKHITSFDNLIKFNAPFIDNGDYPKTIFEELKNICNQAGVELVNTSITNGDFEIQNNQFVNNESLKSVLKAICQISGTYATIKNDKLVLQLKNETNEIMNKSQHEPVTWKRRNYPINQVILGMQDVTGEYVIRQDEEDIAINGVHKLVINDNPFAYTQEKRDLLIDELFNQVKGFGYVPYELKGEWLNYMDIGDTINIDGIDTILLRVSGKSPKSLESEMSAPAIIDSAIQYVDNTDSIKNLMKKTEISVDKQNQIITQVISQTNDLNNKVVKIETTINGTVNTISSSGGSNILKNPIGNFNNDYWEGTGAESYTDTHIQNKTGQRCCWLLNNGSHKQTIQTKNGNFTLSFMFEKIIELANVQFKINNIPYEIKEETSITFNVTDNNITIEFISDVNKSAYVMNLMLNEGTIAQVYSNNPNETITDTVKIGKGIKISATGANAELDAQADGIRIKNTMANQTKTEFTDKGTKTDELEANKATIAKILIADTGNQTWINRL